VAGGFGGVISQLVVYPVDTLKFRYAIRLCVPQ
jgi:hypothetical protein